MGKGIVRAKDYHDIDGLVTDVKNLPLVTFFADCVPLFFVDDVRHVIGLSHSGWRGTAGKIGLETIKTSLYTTRWSSSAMGLPSDLSMWGICSVPQALKFG